MELDPVEYVIIEFPDNQFNGKIAPAIEKLVNGGLVHILDLVFVRKSSDGEIEHFEFDELEDLEAFAQIDGEADGLLNDTDIAEMAVGLAPNSSALFIVWEDNWAHELGRAIRESGGRLLAGERIPHDVVQDSLSSVSD
ncbi:MAG TPA: DUF6325 family protein [Microthrixaceae bacterium]|nr:DUF6325 family protein [Microthrixaceae bacterium]